MTTQTQNVFAETRTFCIREYYEKGGNIFNPISELEERKYTSENRIGALAQAKAGGLLKLASITDITPIKNKPKKIFKIKNGKITKTTR